MKELLAKQTITVIEFLNLSDTQVAILLNSVVITPVVAGQDQSLSTTSYCQFLIDQKSSRKRQIAGNQLLSFYPVSDDYLTTLNSTAFALAGYRQFVTEKLCSQYASELQSTNLMKVIKILKNDINYYISYGEFQERRCYQQAQFCIEKIITYRDI